MRKYTKDFVQYSFYEKLDDCVCYSYDKDGVHEALSDIDSELYTIQDLIEKGLIGLAIENIERLRECL